jgi:hypothetical protein
LNAFKEACGYFKLSADQGFVPYLCAAASCLVNHRIDHGGVSSVAFCAGRVRDLSESEKGETIGMNINELVGRFV